MALSIASYTASAFTTTTTPKTVSISWSAGDTIVVAGGVETGGSLLLPTCPGLIFEPVQTLPDVTGFENAAYIWISTPAAAGGTAQTVSVSRSGGTGQFGIAVWVITGSAAAGPGATFATRAEAAQSLTVKTGSIVCYFLADWNATANNETPLTGSGTATERADANSGTAWGWWIGDWVGTSAGTFTFGPSAFTGMTCTQVAVEIVETGPTVRTAAVSLKSSAGTTTTILTYPSFGGRTGLMALVGRCLWESSATALDEAGWTNTAELAGGTGTAADSHTTKIRVDRRELDGTEGASVTFDQSNMVADSGVLGLLTAYSKPAGSAWDIATATGDDASHGANRSVTASSALSFQAGDVLVAFVAVDTDTDLAGFASPAFTASGITFNTAVRRAWSAGVATGDDGNIEIFDAQVLSGSGSVAPTFAFTTTTNQCGPIAFVRLRATAGVPTLIVDNGAHAHTADNIDLTGVPIDLIVANAVHVHTVTTINFSEGKFATAVSANSRYLLDQHGAPWFGVGDTAWSMSAQLTTSDITLYLEDRAEKGVNLVLLNAPEPHFTSQTPDDANVSGQQPFTGTAFQSTLNEAYWTVVDHAVSEAQRLGITLMITPAYLGVDNTEGWGGEVTAASNAQMTTYGNTLAARYASFPNIIWLMGHDRDPNATFQARYAALGDALQAGTSHLLTVGGLEQLGSAAWAGTGVDYDFDTVYDSAETPAEDTALGWAVTPIKPTGWFEGVYEGERTYENEYNDEPFIRHQMYGPLCSGATYAIFGNNPMWHFECTRTIFNFTGTWESNLNSPGSQKLAIFADLIEMLEGAWALMTPDTTDTFLTVGEGTGTTRSSARFNKTANGIPAALVHRASSGSASITLDLTEFTATPSVQVQKFDPANGTLTSLGTFPTTGTQVFSALGTNAAGDTDWLLIVHATATLVIDNGNHGHTADSPVVTTQYNLAIADSTHGHAVESPSLIQAHVLAVDAAAHAHAANTPTLAVVYLLAVDSAAHTHLADNVAISSTGNLGVDSAAHAHTAASLTLVQNHVLAIDSAQHGHTVTTLDLVQTFLLAVASAVHAHAAENVGISTVGILNVQSAAHAHTADTLAMALGVVVLNDALAVYLGITEVQRVYVGSTQVWP